MEDVTFLVLKIFIFSVNYSKIALLLPGRNNVDVRQRIRVLIRYKISSQEFKNNPNRKKRSKSYYSNAGSSFLYFKERKEAVNLI